MRKGGFLFIYFLTLTSHFTANLWITGNYKDSLLWKVCHKKLPFNLTDFPFQLDWFAAIKFPPTHRSVTVFFPIKDSSTDKVQLVTTKFNSLLNLFHILTDISPLEKKKIPKFPPKSIRLNLFLYFRYKIKFTGKLKRKKYPPEDEKISRRSYHIVQNIASNHQVKWSENTGKEKGKRKNWTQWENMLNAKATIGERLLWEEHAF